MNYNELSITDIHDLLKKNKITSQMLINESIKKAHDTQDTLNAFVTILDNAQNKEITDDYLSGIPYACKDILSTKGILTTASSNTLKDYIPVYNATCIENLNQHNAVMIGKTVLDELGMGGTGTTGHTGIVHNPWNLECMTAGSSAGSAASVAEGIVSYALGTDTGDSVRKPAAYCGIVGYKPTYGVISRYGLFPFASSLDHIGCLTRSVKDAAIVVNSMKSHDEKDMTSIELKDDLLKNIDNNIKGKKLFFIKELCEIENYPDASDELKEILKNYHQTLENITKLGVKIEPVNIDINLLNALYPTYICLSCAEATSNDSNLTGLIFGPRGKGKTYIESMKNYRTNGFSPLIKRRFIIGSYVLQRENQEKYFLNAKRVRRLIVNKMHELFKNYDGMIMPGAAETAKKLKGATEEISLTTLALDNYMVIGNFGGFPSITIPNAFVSSMPTGINITCDIRKDAMLLNIANEIEKTMNYKNQVARRDKQ